MIDQSCQYIVLKRNVDEIGFDKAVIFFCFDEKYVLGWTIYAGMECDEDGIVLNKYYHPKRLYFLHWRYIGLFVSWFARNIYYCWKFRKWVWINTGPMKPDIILGNDNERLRV